MEYEDNALVEVVDQQVKINAMLIVKVKELEERLAALETLHDLGRL